MNWAHTQITNFNIIIFVFQVQYLFLRHLVLLQERGRLILKIQNLKFRV
jgi:hypothetical protein